MKTSRLIFILLLAFVSGTVLSAQDMRFYDFSPADDAIYNPSSVVGLGSRAGVWGKYSFYKSSLYKENPLDLNVGAIVENKFPGVLKIDAAYDGYSYFSTHILSVGYAYEFVFRGQSLCIGGDLNFGVHDVNYDALTYDCGATGRAVHFVPDLSLGVEYRRGTFRVGLGVSNIFANGARVNGLPVTNNNRAILLNISYSFLVPKTELEIIPFFRGGYCNNGLIDVGMSFRWDKLYSLGYTFRAGTLCNIVNASASIPHTPIDLKLSYGNSPAMRNQSVSFGLEYKF